MGGNGDVNSKRSVLEFLYNLWGYRNRVEIGISYRPARLHSLVELILWNRFLGSLKVNKFGLRKGNVEEERVQ